MTRITLFFAASLIGLSGFAVAHTGVTNPVVVARMDVMKETRASTKVLGQMVRGATAFDPTEARAALAEITEHAAETPDAFAAQVTEPNSEALPLIWEEFDAFTSASHELEVARELAATLETKDQLRAGMARIGAACKFCHERYRE